MHANDVGCQTLTIDHIAVAVRSVDAAAERLCRLTGYSPRTSKVTNTRQQVTVLFLSKAGSIDIKLIQPSNPESPLWGFLKRGEGLHHVCFRVPDVQAGADSLVSAGARLLAGPEPGEAFGNNPIAFCYLGAGLNAELVDTDERHDSLDAHPAT